VTVPGTGQADDHLNIKQLQADPSGRVFAVIKTSLDRAGSTSAQIVVLGRSSTGAWSRATFGTVADCHTRPILMLDTTNNLVRVYATAPDSGCAFTGSAGTIFEKTSSMSSLSFVAGRGTPVIRNSASSNLNNATSSKQSVNAASGVVILASNDVTKRYWFSDESLVAPAGIKVGASTTTNSATAATAVSLTKPSATKAGDVLVASITTDRNPTMAAVPTGWTTIVNGLSANSAAAGGARIFAYYHVVTATDPATYGWTLSAAQRWGAGVTAYGGVNTTSPLDSAVVTAVNTSFSGTSLTLPGVTTAHANALLVGGVGLDSVTPLASPPSGWTQEWQATGGQIAEQAHLKRVTAGASGSATWTLSSGRTFGGWEVALRPAG
jgi:hypothetical protein